MQSSSHVCESKKAINLYNIIHQKHSIQIVFLREKKLKGNPSESPTYRDILLQPWKNDKDLTKWKLSTNKPKMHGITNEKMRQT